ncbi:MAG: histidinol-phosphate aminotransferase family protein [Candidatus Aenigmarchaeota archaeon]|nr:histidinol-phosphate aminotransferase family protein [Candidatus Aenigmarchaeota archaeon]
MIDLRGVKGIGYKAAAINEKGGGEFKGIKLALCENPLPPIKEAVEAAKLELEKSNYYTEPYSMRLKEEISNYIDIPTNYIHINAGSELILRQLFSIFGKKTHLLAPTYPLFEEIAKRKTFTQLREDKGFLMDMIELKIPTRTSIAPIVNPNNPTGGVFNIRDALEVIEENPKTIFLIDEAFIEFGGKPAVNLVEQYENLIVTRTFSKGFSLAGFRVGYAILPKKWARYMDEHNDAYPLCRASEAAAVAVLKNIDKVMERVRKLKRWTGELAKSLERLGIKTYPSETYFFLAKIPLDGEQFAKELKERNIMIKIAKHQGLGKNFVKFTTSTPENNEVVIRAVKEIIGEGKK